MKKINLGLDVDKLTDEHAGQIYAMIKAGVLMQVVIEKFNLGIIEKFNLGMQEAGAKLEVQPEIEDRKKVAGYMLGDRRKISGAILSSRKKWPVNTIYRKILKRKGNAGTEARKYVMGVMNPLPLGIYFNRHKTPTGKEYVVYFSGNLAKKYKQRIDALSYGNIPRMPRKKWSFSPETTERRRKMMTFISHEAIAIAKKKGISYADAKPMAFAKYRLLKSSNNFKI